MRRLPGSPAAASRRIAGAVVTVPRPRWSLDGHRSDGLPTQEGDDPGMERRRWTSRPETRNVPIIPIARAWSPDDHLDRRATISRSRIETPIGSGREPGTHAPFLNFLPDKTLGSLPHGPRPGPRARHGT